MDFTLYILVEDSLKNKKHIPFDKWEKILNSPTNLVQLTEDDGSYLGKTLNKSFVISSEPDIDYSIKKYTQNILSIQDRLTQGEIDIYKKHYSILNGNDKLEKSKLLGSLIQKYSNIPIETLHLLENNNEYYE